MEDLSNSLSQLSPEENSIIKNRLKYIEHTIYLNVINKFKILLITMGLIITGGGIFTFTNLKDNIVDKTIKSLTSDDQLKGDVINKINLEIEEIEEAKSYIINIQNSIMQDKIKASKLLDNNLDEILLMLNKVESSLSEGK